MTTKGLTQMLVAAAIVGLLGWWLSDIPIGYYQFRQMCEQEGGLRVFKKLERDQGWKADNEASARLPATIPGVAFVRTVDQGKEIDMRYLGGQGWAAKWSHDLADSSKSVRYQRKDIHTRVQGKIRLWRYDINIIDLNFDDVVARHSQFIFAWTDDTRTLMGRSSSSTCPDDASTALQTEFQRLAFGVK